MVFTCMVIYYVILDNAVLGVRADSYMRYLTYNVGGGLSFSNKIQREMRKLWQIVGSNAMLETVSG